MTFQQEDSPMFLLLWKGRGRACKGWILITGSQMKTVYYQLDVSCTINKAQMKTIHPGYIRNTVTCTLKFVPLFCIIGGGDKKKQTKQSSYTPCGTWGERRYSSYLFLTSALVGGEWSVSRPGRALPQGKDPRYPLYRRLGAPQSRSGHRG
jgi:hypothetical protein